MLAPTPAAIDCRPASPPRVPRLRPASPSSPRPSPRTTSTRRSTSSGSRPSSGWRRATRPRISVALPLLVLHSAATTFIRRKKPCVVNQPPDTHTPLPLWWCARSPMSCRTCSTSSSGTSSRPASSAEPSRRAPPLRLAAGIARGIMPRRRSHPPLLRLPLPPQKMDLSLTLGPLSSLLPPLLPGGRPPAPLAREDARLPRGGAGDGRRGGPPGRPLVQRSLRRADPSALSHQPSVSWHARSRRLLLLMGGTKRTERCHGGNAAAGTLELSVLQVPASLGCAARFPLPFASLSHPPSPPPSRHQSLTPSTPTHPTPRRVLPNLLPRRRLRRPALRRREEVASDARRRHRRGALLAAQGVAQGEGASWRHLFSARRRRLAEQRRLLCCERGFVVAVSERKTAGAERAKVAGSAAAEPAHHHSAPGPHGWVAPPVGGRADGRRDGAAPATGGVPWVP